MSYAQVADLQALFPVTIDAARAKLLLNMASGYIDEYIGGAAYPNARLNVVDRVRPHGGKLLFLPGYTTAVYSVNVEWVDGTNAIDPANTLPSTAWTFHPERNTLERIDGQYWPGGAGTTVYYPSGGSATLSPMGLVIPGSWAGMEITRDTGFAPGSYPQSLINTCVACAARLMTKMPGVVDQRIDNYVVKFEPSGDPLTEYEKDILDQWSWGAADMTGSR